MRNRRDFAGLNTSARIGVVLVAVSCAGCKLYDRGKLDQVAITAGSAAVIKSDAGPDANEGAAGGDAAMAPPKLCRTGDCWWSRDEIDGCHSAGIPSPADRPAGGDDSVRGSDLYLGMTRVWLGAEPTEAESDSGRDPWQALGFDLDGVCTNSATCGGSPGGSCRSPGPAIPFDGVACRDNTFGRLQPVIALMRDLGSDLGLNEDSFNCQLHRGGYNMLVRVQGYNGQPEDPHVRVDYYMSTGLEEPTRWTCPLEDFARQPRWRSVRTWAIDDAALTGPILTPGSLPDSKFADADAYVRGGYLVARVPDATPQGFLGDGEPYRGFVYKAQQGLLVGHLSEGQDGTWQIDDGLLGGRILKNDLIQAFRESGFCEAGDATTIYQSMVDFVNETVDVLASGANDVEVDCDALSYAIGFEAAQLSPGSAAKAPPRVECCAPGKDLSECMQVCGDGSVTRDEACDTAIEPGAKGACPRACPVSEQCVPQELTGSACSAACKPLPMSTMGAEDGCCPKGASALDDSDCKAQCKNNVIEPGETCDPPESCKPCQPPDPCLAVVMTGSANTCDLHCDWKPRSECTPGDGCCPAGCGADGDGVDTDCPTTCGDGMVQRDMGETCDAAMGGAACDTRCEDDENCTREISVGSPENCTIHCVHAQITEPFSGDRCCPGGVSSSVDADCTAACGNKVIETGEACDDGNGAAGDGCFECKKESVQDSCLGKLSGRGSCASCTCMHCATQVSGCYETNTEDQIERCRGLVDCTLDAKCGNPGCFCGDRSLPTCIAIGGNGPCIEQVGRAAFSSELADIGARTTDPNYPLGRANALFDCIERNCPDECGI
jgi:cysteine-rich repeat protein